jgi:hypothetical protein
MRQVVVTGTHITWQKERKEILEIWETLNDKENWQPYGCSSVVSGRTSYRKLDKANFNANLQFQQEVLGRTYDAYEGTIN